MTAMDRDLQGFSTRIFSLTGVMGWAALLLTRAEGLTLEMMEQGVTDERLGILLGITRALHTKLRRTGVGGIGRCRKCGKQLSPTEATMTNYALGFAEHVSCDGQSGIPLSIGVVPDGVLNGDQAVLLAHSEGTLHVLPVIGGDLDKDDLERLKKVFEEHSKSTTPLIIGADLAVRVYPPGFKELLGLEPDENGETPELESVLNNLIDPDTLRQASATLLGNPMPESWRVSVSEEEGYALLLERWRDPAKRRLALAVVGFWNSLGNASDDEALVWLAYEVLSGDRGAIYGYALNTYLDLLYPEVAAELVKVLLALAPTSAQSYTAPSSDGQTDDARESEA